MTEYFEIHGRDCAARRGELRLDESRRTPAAVDDIVTDAGSLWHADQSVPDGDESALTVLPHRALPPGTDETVAEAFETDQPNVSSPSAAVVSPETANDYGTDAYVLAGAPGYVGHAAAFVEAVVAVREAIPDDAALYLSGVATPANVATLVYAGVDLVDEKRARARGLEGFYLTTDGEAFLEDLEELPCACPACQGGREAFTRSDCADHNAAMLRAELSRVRTRISDGRLRDYIEGQARHEAWLTAAFRRLDQQYSYIEERTPVFRRGELLAASDDALRRPEIQRFADRVTSRYERRLEAPLVLVPCSARKPYSESQSHEQFMRAIQYRGHVVSMTSPIGVVPNELETTYPAQHYDSVVTGRWTETEIDFVASVLERYLERANYDRHIAHVTGDGYRDICERVEDSLGISFEYTATDHPTTGESLSALSEALSGEDAYRKETREAATVRAIADYQFGPGAGDAVFGPGIETGGRYPSLRVTDADGTQLAAMVPQYGTLSLSMAGARAWQESDVPTKTVTIDAFVPSGSVLAPGVLDADGSIRPGDEVVFEGPKAVGVGRAAAHGRAMAESTRGVAVDVRHCEEKQ
ncbi:archaeosine synthase [Natronomonas pharaonis DSM 2160]|uniref:Archaeosine synthase n=1 Tax=Natronomonas pharaonis (strain ATCC 35678 / DSM 2160 / CIP 103997 / JCM 8858 / NBRC 14720 / NCIMB 2260 / Gabara) TaxID=348780 RepID=A0A1U7EW92_NATPD|nr:archaeosine synthase subunit alpha [Natronomonas pharaonis]CAI49344.1 archaeosine synthase [Natronomonas pharaonis DSM 2160]